MLVGVLDVLENGSESDRIVDLWLVLSLQTGDFGVASSLDVEDTIITKQNKLTVQINSYVFREGKKSKKSIFRLKE